MEKITKKKLEYMIASMEIDEAVHFIESNREKFSFQSDTLLKKTLNRRTAVLKEQERLETMLHFEKEAYKKGFFSIAGVDEAGRGPLAGPVVAAAVILEPHKTIMGLDDSKKLTPLKREKLFDEINRTALSVSVSLITPEEIDQSNILISTKKAMKNAILNLSLTPQMVLVDYEKIDGISQHQRSIVKGDSLSLSIAAASVIAKVTRDRIMEDLALQYPQYGFHKHKGYGTKDHILAIKQYGICPIHRISFTKNFL